MGMKIDPQKLQEIFDKLSQFARQADSEQGVGDNNSVFLNTREERAWVREKARAVNIADDEIKEYFKQSLKSQGMKKKDIKTLLGAEFSMPVHQNVQSNATSFAAVQETENAARTNSITASESAVSEEDNDAIVFEPATKASAFGSTPSGSQIKIMNEDVLTRIAGLINVENPDFAHVAKNLAASYKGQGVLDYNYYRALIDEVKVVADEMSTFQYNSKDDLAVKYKEIEGKLLNKPDEFTDFKLDVLKRFFVKAEQNQIAKEKQNVSNQFKKLVDGGVPRELAMDLIQNSDWSKEEKIAKMVEAGVQSGKAQDLAESFGDFSGSFYHDWHGKSAEEQFGLGGKRINHLHKGVIHNFEDKNIMAQAKQEVWDAYDAYKGTNVTDPRELQQRAIADLKDPEKPGTYDKYTRKVLRGQMSLKNRFAFKRSSTKSKRHEVTTDNTTKINKNIPYTLQQFLDTLDQDVVFTGLYSSGLVTRREGTDSEGNATFDLSRLSDLIRARVGADLRANPQKRAYYPYSEVENIVKDIGSEIGMTITSADVKHLVDMCGFEVEGKNWAKIALDTVVDSAAGMFSAVGTAFLIGTTAKMVGDILTSATYNGNKGPYSVSFQLDKKIMSSITLAQNDEIKVTIDPGSGGNIDFGKLMYSLTASGKLTSDDIHLDMQKYAQEHVLDITINTSTKNPIQIIKHLEECLKRDVTAEELGIDFNDYEISVEDRRKIEEEKTRVITAIISAIAINLIVNFLKNVMKEDGELPIAVTQFNNNTTFEKYCAQIDLDKNMSDDQKTGFKLLAEIFCERDEKGNFKFDDNGKRIWKNNEYKQCLNVDAAGDASMLSAIEFQLYADNMTRKQRAATDSASSDVSESKQGESVETDGSTKVKKGEKPVVNTDQQVTETPLTGYKDPDRVESLEYTLFYGDKWENIAAAFYDIDKLKDAAKKAGLSVTAYFKREISRDSQGNVRKGYYDKLLQGFIPKSIKLPDKIGDIARKLNEFDKNTVTKAKVEGTPKGYLGSAGSGSKVQGKYHIDGTDSSGITQQEAVDDYNKKHPDHPTSVDKIKWKDE